MKTQYEFYGYDAKLNEVVLAKRSMSKVSVSHVARALREFAVRQFGTECNLVPDSTIIGGYYRNAAGDTVAARILH